MRVFHARVKNADACVSDTQTHFARVFWAQYLRPVLYIDLGQPKSVAPGLGWVVQSPIKLTQDKVEFWVLIITIYTKQSREKFFV